MARNDPRNDLERRERIFRLAWEKRQAKQRRRAKREATAQQAEQPGRAEPPEQKRKTA